jgi:transposase InsO family protein
VFLRIYSDQTERSSVDFLRRVQQAAAFKVVKLLTDNGMVERFNGRISKVVQQTRFASGAELEATLNNYMLIYNHLIPQRSLGHISPVDVLKFWQVKKTRIVP